MNSHRRLVESGGAVARYRDVLRSEGVDRKQQREEYSADIQEVTRHGHWYCSPRAMDAVHRLTSDVVISS